MPSDLRTWATLVVLGLGAFVSWRSGPAHGAEERPFRLFQRGATVAARTGSTPERTPAAARDSLVENARSAAPPELADRATVRDWRGRVLREGESEWICYPDAPDTPRNDPMCLDGTLQELLRSWRQEERPEFEVLGFGYMLQGGGGESASDPYADRPEEVDDWVVAGPHLLVTVPDPDLLRRLPTDPGSGGPWVMWEGTPYVHVMVPVPGRDEPPALE